MIFAITFVILASTALAIVLYQVLVIHPARSMKWLGIRGIAYSESLIQAGHDYELRERQRAETVKRLSEEHLAKGETA